MAPLDDLRARIVALVHPLAPLELPLADARGCVLHEGVQAPAPVPAFDTVSIEGFAVRADSYDPTLLLRVIDEVPAGFRASEQLADGTCIRVSPGAPLPSGSHAVVPLAIASSDPAGIRLPQVVPGQGFVETGAEVVVGAVIAQAGDQLTPRLIGALARSAIRSVHVRPRPRVLAVTVGTEFVEPGVPTPMGLVADYLSFPAAAIAEEAGAIVFRVPPILDDEAELVAIVDDSLHRTDLIVLCGVGAAGRALACASLGLEVLFEAGESGCAVGDREGTVIITIGPDLADIIGIGEALLPAIVRGQMGLAG